MAKGNAAKSEIFNKLLEVFPNSFMYNDGKECRINLTEDGSPVQIKVTLTAAKVSVDPDGSVAPEKPEETFNWDSPESIKPADVKPSEEEQENIRRLATALGF